MGDHQRLLSRGELFYSGYSIILAAEGESGGRVVSRPILGPAWVWSLAAGDTGSALQGPPCLRSLKGTPAGQLVNTAQAWVYRGVRGVCLSFAPPQPCRGSTCLQRVTLCTWSWTSLRSSTSASPCTGARTRALQNPGGTETW